jgi:hypothetical protein
MKTLFEQLTPHNQELVTMKQDPELLVSLKTLEYFNQLNARDLFTIAEVFGFLGYDISFTKAMLNISELFKN